MFLGRNQSAVIAAVDAVVGVVHVDQRAQQLAVLLAVARRRRGS